MNETTLDTRFELTPKGRAAVRSPRPIVITQDAKDAFLSRDLLRRALAALVCNDAQERRIIGGVIACYLREPIPATCEVCNLFAADCACHTLEEADADELEIWEDQPEREPVFPGFEEA